MVAIGGLGCSGGRFDAATGFGFEGGEGFFVVAGVGFGGVGVGFGGEMGLEEDEELEMGLKEGKWKGAGGGGEIGLFIFVKEGSWMGAFEVVENVVCSGDGG